VSGLAWFNYGHTPISVKRSTHRVLVRGPIVNARFSLGQLFCGVTLWSICFGVVALGFELPNWTHALAVIVSLAATMFLFAKPNSVIVAGLLSLPLICIANISSFTIAFGYVFGDTGFVSTTLGPVAWVAGWPVVLIQNALPIEGVGDTVIGIATVSFVETLAVVFGVALWRSTTGPRHLNSN
jgi:hypothetical protein